jgi:hypothetical protein
MLSARGSPRQCRNIEISSICGIECATPCSASETAHLEQRRRAQGSAAALAATFAAVCPATRTPLQGTMRSKRTEFCASTSVDGHGDTQFSAFDRAVARM